MKQQSANVPHNVDHDGHQTHGNHAPLPPLPTVGPPLDGSQYQNIVEEQKYSGQRPTHQEQQPERANRDKAL